MLAGSAQHVTRFLSLAKVGNAEKKKVRDSFTVCSMINLAVFEYEFSRSVNNLSVKTYCMDVYVTQWDLLFRIPVFVCVQHHSNVCHEHYRPCLSTRGDHRMSVQAFPSHLVTSEDLKGE